ncbi:MAG: molybdopterin molybdotransferase MoeA, partial [Elusimicrobia bacterium]|nr:molybdopterin molybdotransferase MoeA [Elusimicrobiota bacterium]
KVLASDLYALEDLPQFDNSAMDGFAVKVTDVQGASRENPVQLSVRSIMKAGKQSREECRSGEAVKIMTGAPMPVGTDTVVMKEMTSTDGNGAVQIYHGSKKGENVRFKGEDIHRGDLILKSGTLIRPYEVSLLAAQGIAAVSVVRNARVSVLASGDELMEGPGPLAPGMIRNSNGPAVECALKRWGAEVVYQGVVPDHVGKLELVLRKLLAKSDIVLVSGGISVGDFDLTKSVLEKIGVQEIFWKVAIKPGKPLYFGLWNNKPVFGLPGNPVSALVCVEEFVRPALEKMQGYQPQYPGYHLKGTLENDYAKPEDRQQYLFCQVAGSQEGFKIQVIKPQGSAMLGMATRANALAIAPLGVRLLKRGTPVSFRWLK